MPYTYSLPTSTSFTGKGLLGYAFGPLKQNVDVYYIEVEKGHDTFMISRKIKRIYYVLIGTGYFTIDNQEYDVRPGLLVEVPPGVEYCYSGKMTLIGFATPAWFDGNDTHTRWNPDVVGRHTNCAIDRGTWVARFLRWKIFGKSPLGAYLRLNRLLWNHLPSSFSSLGPIRSYGSVLHRLVGVRQVRAQAFSTLFLRNRPELELIRRLIDLKRKNDTLRVAVLGCSTGPQAYSVMWRIRSTRPDLKVILHAVDISRPAVEIAKSGVYALAAPQLTASNIVERMTTAEVEELFDRGGDVLTVKPWVKEGINWHVADVREPEIVDMLGPQDLVVADNFLCHMDALEAESCLRNITRLVSPYGYLFVSGIDLNIRTRVACDLGWTPLQELLEEIHDGDPWLRRLWPFEYGGLEPLNKRKRDWKIRYAAAFQSVPRASSPSPQHEDEVCAHVQR